MFRSHFAVSAAALVLAACAEKAPTGPAEPLEALPRQLSAAEQVASAAANRFAFDLLRELHGGAPDSNAFISPLSVSMALGMTANGAVGGTLDAMRDALRVSDVPEAELNAAYRDLVALLRELDPAVDLRIANSVWLHEDFPFHSAFSDVVHEYFGATSTTLDLYAPDALTRINGWAGDNTNGKITTVLESMPDDARALLMNAVYFNGAWRDRFDVAHTHDAPFLSGTGAPVSARLMTQASTFRYTESTDVQAVELPYGNGAFVMTVLLPKPGRTLAALVNELDTARWNGIVSAMRQQEVELFLPKLQLR
jgi:serpin B